MPLAEAAAKAGAEFIFLPEYCGGLASEGAALRPKRQIELRAVAGGGGGLDGGESGVRLRLGQRRRRGEDLGREADQGGHHLEATLR